MNILSFSVKFRLLKFNLFFLQAIIVICRIAASEKSIHDSPLLLDLLFILYIYYFEDKLSPPALHGKDKGEQ